MVEEPEDGSVLEEVVPPCVPSVELVPVVDELLEGSVELDVAPVWVPSVELEDDGSVVVVPL